MNKKIIIITILFVLAIIPFVLSAPEDQYLHAYNFNGNTLNTTDYNLTGNLTATNTPTVTTGIIQNATYFTRASSQYFRNTSGTSLPIANGSMSISLWVKPASTPTTQATDNCISGNPFNLVEISNSSAMKVQVSLCYQTVLTIPRISANILYQNINANKLGYPITLPTTAYTHIVYTFNASSSSALNQSIYINGTLKASQVATYYGGTSGVVGEGLYIGANHDGTTFQGAFDGAIDNIVIYNYALNSANITYLYNSGLGKEPPFNAPPSPDPTNTTITATDFYTSATIYNLTAIANGTTYTTTNGTVVLPYISNQNGLINISLNASDNGGYYTKNFTNQNLNTSLATNLIQSINTFYGYEKYTNNYISGLNVNSTYLNNITHYMKVATYSLNTIKSGYYSTVFSYTPTLLTTTNYHISDIYNATLNISANEHYTGSTINNYTLNLYNLAYNINETYYVNTYILLNITNNIDYTIKINKSGYISNTTYSYQTNNATNLTVNLYKNNRAYITFRDEETLSLLTNVTYSFISSSTSLNGTTDTLSYVELDNLTSLEYELRYTKTNYNPRSYYITFPISNFTYTNLTVYSLLNSSAFVFTLFVTDKYALPQPDLKVSLLRRYPIGGQTVYYVVEQMKPSYALSGQASFSAVANNVPYLFRVEQANGNIVFQGAGTTTNDISTLYLISNPIYIRATLDSNPFTQAQQLEGFYSNLTNTSNTIWFSVSDSANVISEMCLKIVANNTITLYDYCTTNKQTILSYVLLNTNANNTQYKAFGYVKTTSNTIILKTLSMDFVENKGYLIFGNFGIFFTLLTIIIISVGFADKPIILVSGIALTLMAFGTQALGFIGLSLITQSSILVLSIILIFVLKDG